MSSSAPLLQINEVLTLADHHTHRRYAFQVAPDSQQLEIWVRYAPKRLDKQHSSRLAEAALGQQAAGLASRIGAPLAEQWSTDNRPRTLSGQIANLLTMSLDDADGNYRGAGHRHADDQHLRLGAHAASPGLVVGPLPPGTWTLTLSAHTLASDQCEVSIQIGAEIASSR